MKKIVLIISFLLFVVSAASADNFELCQGKVIEVDDVLSGYSSQAGGLLIITINGTSCGNSKFWYEDDGVKTSNLLSMAMTALAAGKTVRIIYDESLAYYGTKGKIHRVTIYD